MLRARGWLFAWPAAHGTRSKSAHVAWSCGDCEFERKVFRVPVSGSEEQG